MDIDETVQWLGRVNAGKCYPKRFDNIDQSLPYFRIEKEGTKHSISMFNYKTHDNAERMVYMCSYLLENILPLVKGNVCGYYSIQLHDSYTYLNDGLDYTNVLCFGMSKKDRGPVVLPDCYFLGDWGGKYKVFQDNIPWKSKESKVSFYGTTTGNRDPSLNERINVCLWAISKPWCDFKITKIAQMSPALVLEKVQGFKQIYSNPVPLSEQIKNRYQLIIDGNVSKWDVDCYYSNCLGFSMPSNNMLWYYPMLQAGEHYVPVSTETMEADFMYYENNANEAQRIVSTANKLANGLFKAERAAEYTVSLFESIAENK
jgi:hypothetical protein